MTKQSDEVTVPLREVLFAMGLIDSEWGEGRWKDELPSLIRLLEANRDWVEWSRFERSIHADEDNPTPEPTPVVPVELQNKLLQAPTPPCLDPNVTLEHHSAGSSVLYNGRSEMFFHSNSHYEVACPGHPTLTLGARSAAVHYWQLRCAGNKVAVVQVR